MTPIFDYCKNIESLISQGETYKSAFVIYHRGIIEDCLERKRYAALYCPLNRFSHVCQHLFRASYLTEELYDKTIELAVNIDAHMAREPDLVLVAKTFELLGDLFDNLKKRWEASSYFERSACAYHSASEFSRAASVFERAAKQHELLKKKSKRAFFSTNGCQMPQESKQLGTQSPYFDKSHRAMFCL